MCVSFFALTPNISCTTANSPSTLNSIPKLRSKTCQLDVFVITDINQKLKTKIQRITFNNNSPVSFTIHSTLLNNHRMDYHLKRRSKR
ncbi:hypothetical protein C9J12_29495 [Photobacterium frigidiphilum]|uniref:Uncharacterized protein n=1 Tax=Photobacterium frigidiphilum TaxID=264736 RepID=A0A2T3J5S3_9GAMM|nr:hypothetical protein C9J12_29495 [Photobacterium frigidiphilum]